MSPYKVRIRLTNDDEIEYGVDNCTVTYSDSDAPHALTNKEQSLIHEILINIMTRIAVTGVKKLEIEEE